MKIIYIIAAVVVFYCTGCVGYGPPAHGFGVGVSPWGPSVMYQQSYAPVYHRPHYRHYRHHYRGHGYNYRHHGRHHGRHRGHH